MIRVSSIGYKNEILILLMYSMVLACNRKDTFFDHYKEFKITIRAPERLVSVDNVLTMSEKLRLKKVFDINGVAYKDTLGSIYIDKREFYDDPKLFFLSYSDYVFDTIYFNRIVSRFDSLKLINSSELSSQ